MFKDYILETKATVKRIVHSIDQIAERINFTAFQRDINVRKSDILF